MARFTGTPVPARTPEELGNGTVSDTSFLLGTDGGVLKKIPTGSASIYTNAIQQFKTVALLQSDEVLSYNSGGSQVVENDLLEAGGFQYRVAAPDAADYLFETSGGVRVDDAGRETWRAPRHSVAGLAPLIRDMLLAPHDDSGLAFDEIEILGLGSSVMGLEDGEGTIVDYFAAQLKEKFDITGSLTVSVNNQQIDGSTVISAVNDWSTILATVSSTAKAKLAIIGYGRNDAAPAAFNTGQTFGNFPRHAARLSLLCLKAGITPIWLTSPSRHTGRQEYAMASVSQDQTWPTAVTAPVDPDVDLWPTADNSVVTVSRGGMTANGDVREMMVNQAIRVNCAQIPGTVLIEVEPYAFEAQSMFGQDALFAPASHNHENQFGREITYYRAIREALTIARDGASFENFVGNRWPRLIAGIDGNRAGQIAGEEIDPDAPFSLVATDQFTNYLEAYGDDRELDFWIARHTDDTDAPTPITARRAWKSGRGASRTIYSVSQDWRPVSAASPVSYTVPGTIASGRLVVWGKSASSGSGMARTLQWANYNGTITLEEIGSGVVSGGSATDVVTVTISSGDFVFTAEDDNTDIVMDLEWVDMT